MTWTICREFDRILDDHKTIVGVSLLAIAVYQPTLMLNVSQLSRAGSLLQIGGVFRYCAGSGRAPCG
ncbi:hypothetical protein E4T63_14420 [Pseudomonas fluorescens]|uniref:Uncharacterized protein n=1 Tax=Pseudomonas fluorescens TaxID=294 RepID=A0AAP8Z1X8_PSEFL|nr:hypothetical protein E4T63_14420 [Pseudomonas fluorescens]